MNDATKSYFDLHTTGHGWISRIRKVEPKKGQPFWACTVEALYGSTQFPSRRFIDMRVSGSEAQRLLREHAEKDTSDKLFVEFRAGDLWTDVYTRTKGDQAGTTAVSIKARLLQVKVVNPLLLGFDHYALVTRGVGYLNRIHRFDDALAVSIAALNGSPDDLEYRYFDVRVVSEEMQRLMRRCENAVSEEKKVLVSFRLDDLQAKLFTRTKGDRAGETDASLKSALVHVGMIKVDGDKVYEAPRREETETADDPQPEQPAEAAQAEQQAPRQAVDTGSVGAGEAATA